MLDDLGEASVDPGEEPIELTQGLVIGCGIGSKALRAGGNRGRLRCRCSSVAEQAADVAGLLDEQPVGFGALSPLRCELQINIASTRGGLAGDDQL